MAKTVIVIPTYNERQNLERLLTGIFSLAVPDLSVLVVDDNSPDGTGKLADQLAAANPRIRVLHRIKKAGLGAAYVAGFTEALRGAPDYIFEMDADLSHDPKYIPYFLRAIGEHDLVIGSRYVSGGGVSNWSAFRQAISRFGNWYARTILRLPYRDITGGYKCYRREALERINLDRLSSVGYNFQIETTYRVHRLGLRIKEIPIVFVERAMGKSKFSVGIMVESFWRVILLRRKL